ncbi:MAG: hypothetical protein AAB554_00785 [Patescibacteria group bacterium]
MSEERIGIPKIGDVITCAAFENGWRRKDEANRPVWVTDDDGLKLNAHEESARDAVRATAAFVVEESCRSDSDHISWTERRLYGYGGIFECDEKYEAYAERVAARRLAPDGTYDPEGETIRFNRWSGSAESALGLRLTSSTPQATPENYRRHAIMRASILKIGTLQRFVRFE